jgi:hypothetical protein
MSSDTETVSKGPPADVHVPVSGRLPVDPPVDPPPPTPTTFDFTVSSLTVKNPRALYEDSDYATLAINVLAADNTVLQQYGPVTKNLGGLGKGLSINPNMSLTGMTVPDGGTLSVAFIVLNKGAWSWDSETVNALEVLGGAVLGAIAQGTIAAPAAVATTTAGASTTLSPAFPYIVAAAAAIVAILEGINVIFADCDGTVVPGTMTIGKTELLGMATPGPWTIFSDYPGTDSAIGCGANSDYSVTYSVEATPQAVSVPRVAVPNVVGMSAADGVVALREAGLIGIEKLLPSDVETPSNIVGQIPTAGTMVAAPSEVQYEIKARPVVTNPKGGSR